MPTEKTPGMTGSDSNQWKHELSMERAQYIIKGVLMAAIKNPSISLWLQTARVPLLARVSQRRSLLWCLGSAERKCGSLSAAAQAVCDWAWLHATYSPLLSLLSFIPPSPCFLKSTLKELLFLSTPSCSFFLRHLDSDVSTISCFVFSCASICLPLYLSHAPCHTDPLEDYCREDMCVWNL